MTIEPAFYDLAMTDPDAPAMIPLAESPWLPLYQEAAAWIPANHDVVDLGCGGGAFLDLLAYQGHGGALRGCDFSPAALDARVVGEHVATLELADLREWQPDPKRRGHTTYTCLEVLEHLEDDRDLVRRIPSGHQVIVSLPSFESEAHLRVFRNVSDVWRRYSDLLNFRRWSLIRLDDRKAIHCVDTTRRQDSW